MPHVPTVKDIAHLPVDQLPPVVHVPPVMRPFDITVRPPGSKSLTNRALLLAALAEGTSVLTGALAEADDAQVMVRALRQLGAAIEITPEVEPNGESCGNATMKITGVGGRWKIKPGETVTLNLNNAGTAVRFLTAAAILQPADSGGIVIDGNERMRERPIGELVDSLTEMGVRVEYLKREGYPPIRVTASAPESLANRVTFTDPQSSQFVSALALISPLLPEPLRIEIRGRLVSASYMDMTESVLDSACWTPNHAGRGSINQKSGVWVREYPVTPLRRFSYAIEPDASGATYFLGAATLVPRSRAVVHGIRAEQSPQGDSGFADVARAFGGRVTESGTDTFVRGARSIEPISWDFGAIPDAVMTAAAMAAFAPSETTMFRVRTLRVKETDRIEALRQELARVAVAVSAVENDGDEDLRITPPAGGIDCSPTAPPVHFDTYDDHRMAMSLALIGLRRPNVFINNPACVRKTYPTFWRDLAKVYG